MSEEVSQRADRQFSYEESASLSNSSVTVSRSDVRYLRDLGTRGQRYRL